MRKHRKLPRAYTLFTLRLVLLLLLAIILLESIFIIAINFGAVKTSSFNFSLIETIVSLLIFIIISTLVISIANQMVLQPLYDLQEAITEVSKGNFDIGIEYKKNDEFTEVIERFNQMVIELNSIKTMRNDFVNIFSHECKTPISSIRGFAKQLQRSDLTKEERDEYLQIILNESERLTKLHERILLISSYSNRQFLTNLEYFSLDEQIRKCILLFEDEWEAKNIEFVIDLDPMTFYSCEDTLNQVWINILSNAIKFSKDGGMIKIHGKSYHDKVIVKITDYGIGMDQETLKHIFDKYFTSSKSVHDGNGLGMTIAKRIVELSRGDIIVTSEPNEWTLVEVHLPRLEHTSA